ncbi:MAG: hypothetical protein JRF64_04510, partial [Deltaproteobacteria bacterium]|nr:hypothetical protein [Deltaproteobacteria bacterium]
GAILTIFVHQSQTNAAQQEVAYAQQNVRAAMDLMVREIRNAGYDPHGNDFDAVATADANTIQVLSNLSGDDEGLGNPPNDANEDVTYTVNASNQLTRNGTRIVDFVEFLQFHYYLRDGTELDPPGAPLTATQRGDIRAVVVVLAVRTENPAPDTRKFRIRSLVSGARVRNLGFQDIP